MVYTIYKNFNHEIRRDYLGNTIISKLAAQGKLIRGLALPNDNTISYTQPNVEIVHGDVRDKDSLTSFFSHNPDTELIVIHTAAIVSISSKVDKKVVDVNVNGTKNIVELCLRHKVKKLVHTSSVHAIPEKSHGETITEVSEFDPKSVHGLYAKTKAAASQIVLNAVKQGLNASIVHPSGIIGPGDYGRTHLTQLVISYLNGTLTACVNGGYDFVDVRDVADGIISCVENGRAGECYILSNQFYTIQEVLDDLHEITGKRRLKSVLPLWFAKLTAPLAEVWYKMLRQPPLYTSYSLYTLESNGNFSHEKATQELGYHPRSMKDTLTDMAYWLESYNRIKFKFKTAHAV